MMNLIREYSVYIMVILGLVIGYGILSYLEMPWKKACAKRFLLCVLFSSLSMFSVLCFASAEQFLFEGEFSFGAVSTYGIYLISPFILLAVTRKDNRAKVFDAYAVYVLPSLFLQRIRCLTAGCCKGVQIFTTGLCWPTREAELVFYAAVLWLFAKEITNGRVQAGILFPKLMVYYSAFRFFEEWVREGRGIIHPAHIWSVIVFALGISIFTEMKKKYQRED